MYEESSLLTQLLCGGAALLFIGGVFWALRSAGRRAEGAARDHLDHEAALCAADWLAQRLSTSRERALAALQSADATSAEALAWREARPQVKRVFERVGRAQYTVTIALEAAQGERFTRTRALSLDELPDPVRVAILRGEPAVTILWRPQFQQEEA